MENPQCRLRDLVYIGTILTIPSHFNPFKGGQQGTSQMKCFLKPQIQPGFREQFWLTLNLVQWTVSERDLWAKYSDLITLCLVCLELATTGPRATIQRARSWWMLWWMQQGERQSIATVFRGSSLCTPWEGALARGWGPF